MRRSVRWLGLLGLAALGVWLAWPTSEPVAPPKFAAAPKANALASESAGPEGQGHSIWALAARATVVADEATVARLSPDWDASDTGRQESAAWCRRGQAARAQVDAAADSATSAPAPGEAEPSDAELLAARDRALRRWAAHLRGQSSARAQAAGDFLLGGLGDAGQAARQRLIAAGRIASDPMVIALALQRCADDDCSSLSLRWVQLEPTNLQAWLHAADILSAGWLLRGAAQATESRNYHRELVQLLLGSPQALGPGLRDAAEVMLLFEVEAAWGLPRWQAVLNLCRQVNLSVEQGRQCLAIADGVWRAQDEALVSRVLALRLSVSQGVERDPLWRNRATQAEAALQWASSEHAERMLPVMGLLRCDPGASQTLRERLRQGEVQRVADAMLRSGADVETLAAQRRATGSGALLRPLAPLAAASR